MYSESDADYDRICQIEPGNTLGYMGKGRNAFMNKRYQEAAELFSHCIRLDHSFSQAYAYRSECYLKLNCIDEGLDDIISALNLDNNSIAYNLMMQVGEPEVNTLIAKLKVQSIKEPNNGEWHFYLGNVYESIYNYVKAIDNYKVCVKIDPNDVAYSRISACYSELGDYELALENINIAAEMDSNDADYVRMKADLLYDMGKGKEAIKAYDDYIKANPEFWGGYYRRGFLKDNLKDVNVKMIDSQGYGIHNMFVRQKERYLPMPDYDGSSEDHVVMHMPGTVIDENYSLMLMSNNDISLTDTVLLDQLQKGKMIKDTAIDMLKKKRLIEGRRPNIYIAKSIAQSTDQKVEYSRHKGLNAKSCEAVLLESLRDHGKLTRQEIDKLLWEVLSDQLDEKQKKIKIGNLLTKLKKGGLINNTTRGNLSEWSLLNS